MHGASLHLKHRRHGVEGRFIYMHRGRRHDHWRRLCQELSRPFLELRSEHHRIDARTRERCVTENVLDVRLASALVQDRVRLVMPEAVRVHVRQLRFITIMAQHFSDPADRETCARIPIVDADEYRLWLFRHDLLEKMLPLRHPGKERIIRILGPEHLTDRPAAAGFFRLDKRLAFDKIELIDVQGTDFPVARSRIPQQSDDGAVPDMPRVIRLLRNRGDQLLIIIFVCHARDVVLLASDRDQFLIHHVQSLKPPKLEELAERHCNRDERVLRIPHVLHETQKLHDLSERDRLNVWILQKQAETTQLILVAHDGVDFHLHSPPLAKLLNCF